MTANNNSLRRWLFFLALLAFISFALPIIFTQIGFLTSDSQGPGLFGVYPEEEIRDMEELIETSDHIIIGTVGQILAREYPLSYRKSEFSEEEWSNLNRDDRYITQHRIAFHEIIIEEVLKGDQYIGSTLPLLRMDVEHYSYIELSAIKEGERLLIFVEEEEGDSNYAKSFNKFYTAFDDNGIFDIEFSRAYPRLPSAFKDQTGEYYNKVQEPSRPFFEIGKLREAINLAK